MHHSLLYDLLCYILVFGSGGAVKASEKEESLISYLLNHDGICRASPGFARLAKQEQSFVKVPFFLFVEVLDYGDYFLKDISDSMPIYS